MKNRSREYYRDYISSLVTRGAVKAALSWIAKKAAFVTVGPLGWILSIILERLWNFLGDKLVRLALRKGALIYDKVDGSIKARKIEKARGKNDSSYDDAVDDIFK